MREKFYITNVSCASCANKIENALQKLECVNYAYVDVNNNILEIDTTNINLVIKTIKQIDYNVNIDKETSKEFDKKKELIFLGILIAVFFIVIFILHTIENEIIKYISIAILAIIYLISGKDIFKNAFRNLRDFFNENTLMVLATISAFAIGAYEEAIAVMLFFKTGELLQELALQNSKKSIKNLLQIAPNIAHLKKDSNIIEVEVKDLNINDIIIIKPGEKVPTDGIVINGKSLVDTKALTGEPIPKVATIDTKILGGTLNLNGMLEVKVSKLYKDSSFAKIIDLVQNASKNKAKIESFITKFAKVYTPIVFFLALIIAIFPVLFGFGNFNEWIYRALVVLMVSCPCALVISVPLAYFGGIGSCSKNSILIKGANYLDALSNVTNIAFDKTGTLTKGIFKVIDIVPENGFSKEELLQYAFCAENFSNHPIALAIKDEYNKTLSLHQCNNTKFEQINGLGIVATCNYKEILAGNDKMLHKYNIEHNNCNFDKSVAHIAINGIYAGYILVSDELKDDTKETIKSLQMLGIKMMVLSGDNELASKPIIDSLDIKDADYDLLPEEKAESFMQFKKNANGTSIFVGDGVNDAPCIAIADVGVSMGKLGSDVSKESADVIIINDKISSVLKAIKIAKKTKQIIWQNIAFALGVKVLFIIVGLFGVATMWEAVFGDVGVALLALLNSMRILKA